MDTAIEPKPQRLKPRLVADRTIDELYVGVEWEPKLAAVMVNYPHDDSEFDPGKPKENEPHTPERLAEMKARWRERIAELPTERALAAWNEVHLAKLSRLKALLAKCDVSTAGDIEKLGCTGATKHDLSLTDIQFLRLALAGSGVGLPCFVPPDRYCLAHEVSGGLQDEQDQLYPEFVAAISRELSPSERVHAGLVEAAKNNEDGPAAARRVLRGKKLPDGWEQVDGTSVVDPMKDGNREFGGFGGAEVDFDKLDGDLRSERAEAQLEHMWECAEHSETNWACRYCVAQAIVEGELEPQCIVQNGQATVSGDTRAGSTIEKFVEDMERAGANELTVYVQVAQYTRKLTRVRC